jgi:hypothetical protein
MLTPSPSKDRDLLSVIAHLRARSKALRADSVRLLHDSRVLRRRYFPLASDIIRASRPGLIRLTSTAASAERLTWY